MRTIDKRALLGVLLLVCFYKAQASDADTVKPWSIEGSFFYGKIFKHDAYVKSTLKNGPTRIYDLRLGYADRFSEEAEGYAYPTYGVGFSVVDFGDVTLYHASDLGNLYVLYLFWNQHLLDFGRFRWTCQGDIGPVYNTDTFDPIANQGKDFSSSALMMYIGLTTGLKYRLSDRWEIGTNVNIRHYSNGRLGVINKGFNIVGGTLTLAYHLSSEKYAPEKKPTLPVHKGLYYHISAGGGVQTYIEDWLLYIQSDDAYQQPYIEKYHPKYFISTDAMYRFSRQYGGGLGVDLFYTPSLNSLQEWDLHRSDYAGNPTPEYRFWSVGIAWNQEIYYKNLALTTSLGYYLYRKMGWREKTESPVYERFGLRYYFPQWSNVFGSCSVKAHKFHLAEYFELSVGKKF
ncbi:MAG: acyloxyacyl hydrolase [Dysgonamonadaceae bacterium]|nr:acyloxyacyl hydrolase [Dysgonamonadaceae bacterium]